MSGVSDVASAQAALAFSYDQIPYDSQPYADARPAYLGALGLLHGLRPAKPSACRVLELGCASGGHLIPLAWYHPESEFVGIDLSEGQIRAGRELIRATGLANCTLQVGDLCGFQAGTEGFDYVIAHGLYSWVPDHVRKALLSLCRAVLRPGGIAYISYNTLPGWRMRGSTRDLIEWHLEGVVSPQERLDRARALIDHLAGAADLDSPSSYLEMEVARISSRPPSYLAHEFLEPENKAFLFSEFVDDAMAHGLRYLCNADLATGFPQMYHELGEAMVGLTNDPVKLEQYLDFVASRAFRQSLLCRDDEPPTFLDHDLVGQLLLVGDFRPPPKLDLRRTRVQHFKMQDGSEFEVSHPLCKAALGELSRCYPRGVAFPALMASAAQQVRERGDGRYADDLDGAFAELFGLLIGQRIEPLLEASVIDPLQDGRPRAHRLALCQAALGWPQVTTALHRSIDLDAFSRALLGLLDGTRERDELTVAMLDWVVENRRLDEEGRRHARRQVESGVSRLLKLYARHGVLAGA